jgi:hypothetical protein
MYYSSLCIERLLSNVTSLKSLTFHPGTKIKRNHRAGTRPVRSKSTPGKPVARSIVGCVLAGRRGSNGMFRCCGPIGELQRAGRFPVAVGDVGRRLLGHSISGTTSTGFTSTVRHRRACCMHATVPHQGSSWYRRASNNKPGITTIYVAIIIRWRYSTPRVRYSWYQPSDG